MFMLIHTTPRREDNTKPEHKAPKGDTCRQRAEKQPIREDRRDPNMNSGGSAPADMGGELPDGRARGQPCSQRRSARSQLLMRRSAAGMDMGTRRGTPALGHWPPNIILGGPRRNLTELSESHVLSRRARRVERNGAQVSYSTRRAKSLRTRHCSSAQLLAVCCLLQSAHNASYDGCARAGRLHHHPGNWPARGKPTPCTRRRWGTARASVCKDRGHGARASKWGRSVARAGVHLTLPSSRAWHPTAYCSDSPHPKY